MTTIGGNFLVKKEPTVLQCLVLILFNDAWATLFENYPCILGGLMAKNPKTCWENEEAT